MKTILFILILALSGCGLHDDTDELRKLLDEIIEANTDTDTDTDTETHE